MTRVPFLEFKDLDFTGDDLTGVSGVGLGYISWEGLKDHLQDLAGMLREEREKSAKLQADLDALAMSLGQAEQDKAALSSSLQEARDEEKTWMLACNLAIREKMQAIGERDEARLALDAQDGDKPPAGCPETWEGSDAFPGGAA